MIDDLTWTSPDSLGRLDRILDELGRTQRRFGLGTFHHGQEGTPCRYAFFSLGNIPSANVKLSTGNQEGLGTSIEGYSGKVGIGIGGSKGDVGGAGEYNLHGLVVGRDGVGIGHLKLSLDENEWCLKSRLVVGRDIELPLNVEAIDCRDGVFGQVVLDALSTGNNNLPATCSRNNSRHESIRTRLTLGSRRQAGRVTLKWLKDANVPGVDVETTASRPAIFSVFVFFFKVKVLFKGSLVLVIFIRAEKFLQLLDIELFSVPLLFGDFVLVIN